MDELEVEGYINLSVEHMESSKILFLAGKYRTSISSSYYAMFSIAKALLVTVGEEPATHKGLISLFGRYFVKTGKFDKEVFQYLTRTKTTGKQADYEYDYVTNELEAKEILENAKLL